MKKCYILNRISVAEIAQITARLCSNLKGIQIKNNDRVT